MATSASISIVRDNIANGIYCYSNGYVSNTGELLKQFYTDEKKVEELISLGNISVLSESIECPEGHTWENPVEGYTIAYHRDRGQKFKKLFDNYEIDTLRDIQQCSYNYLFEDGEWYLIKNGEKCKF
jgi:hypothetical protein